MASLIADAGLKRFIDGWLTHLSRCEPSILLSRLWLSARDSLFAKYRYGIALGVAENQNMEFDNFYGSRCSTWRVFGGLPGADVRWPQKKTSLQRRRMCNF
jgi:hypothetical protein